MQYSSVRYNGKNKRDEWYVRVIQGGLVRNNENWQDWKFQQLVDALEKWTARNPIPLGYKRNPEKCNSYSSKSYLAKQKKG